MCEGEKQTNNSNADRCSRQVSKEQASEHSVPHSSPKHPFLGTAVDSLGRASGGTAARRAGPAMREKEGKESGDRARGKGGGGARAFAELTHRHVGARSNKGVGHGVDELAAHAKVTQLDFPARVDQDVGGLHIYVKEGEGREETGKICLCIVLNHDITQ